MIGTTLAPTSCTNTMSRGLHLVTQTIQLTDDLVEQVFTPLAALEEITINKYPCTHKSAFGRPADS